MKFGKFVSLYGEAECVYSMIDIFKSELVSKLEYFDENGVFNMARQKFACEI